MKIFVCFLLNLFCLSGRAQFNAESEIRKLLNDQEIAWNHGNIDEFMKGYWKSDSMMFIGKSGITYGYPGALERYRKTYSDTVKMGQLRYDLLRLEPISSTAFFVVGKWYLKRTIGDLGGIFTLVFRKIGGKWFIVADHTS
jgi:hypothetical protein